LTQIGVTGKAEGRANFAYYILFFPEWGQIEMSAKTQRGLHELCSQALAEKDPHKLIALLREINDVLARVLTEVDRVLQKNEYPA